MANDIDLDPALLERAMRLGGHLTERSASDEALREYVERRERLGILELFGTIEYDEEHDYKTQRRRP